ncbi:MBOAT family protein [Fictibacillus sp. 7GRE50]|uniref:MBOAT family O-acyltransferase n=1 Tax=Fictibacillus sp. 7GRE50 TaxID=2745878 RepID=UPI0018CD2CB5|nr:MBOAT family protein [Fictibacillus sp. 7GRE50]MBH0164089.1 MBOAT family protein [Fictibacillus sp. 7GRE50]
MLFNSYEFIFMFLPISLFIYFLLNKWAFFNLSKYWLVIVSLFFYSWWNIAYLPLILASIIFNYLIGYSLGKNKNKSLLMFGIICNLAALGYFKYYDFFISTVNEAANANLPLLEIALPLAISFFTFTEIAYLVDSYRNETKEYSFINYVLFVTFFPHLIAGPIVHHKELAPQFSKKENMAIHHRNMATGLFIFFLGLFKKVVIADTFAVWATSGFSQAGDLTFAESWIASISYTLQLYFDFSGYSDMAIGASLLFNIKLPINFYSPYKAIDIQDFWRRWHITLSRFLRDYIYIPLGGNRKGTFNLYRNLMITFLIGGIWHGAGWTFVFWGFLHGAALVIHRMWKNAGLSMPKVMAWLITFQFVNLAWVFFRAETWKDAIEILSSMYGMNGIVWTTSLFDSLSTGYALYQYLHLTNSQFIVLSILFFLGICLFARNSVQLMENFRPDFKTAILTAGIALYSILSLYKVSEFLYFQF